MLSAIVLTPDLRSSDEPRHAKELILDSLVWLVSAVVAGAVRDVILAAPALLDLAEVVDQSGCDLVQAKQEAARLATAISASRCQRLLVIRSGFLPEPGLVDELVALLRHPRTDERAVMVAAPETAWQRVFPNRAPVVGVLLPRPLALRAIASERLPFKHLVKTARRGRRLHSSARRAG